eukprot:324939-Chlamydomonas_euryale.AAC.3
MCSSVVKHDIPCASSVSKHGITPVPHHSSGMRSHLYLIGFQAWDHTCASSFVGHEIKPESRQLPSMISHLCHVSCQT